MMLMDQTMVRAMPMTIDLKPIVQRPGHGRPDIRQWSVEDDIDR